MVNLVPMLDALITMIAFLLYSMSMLALVSIDSPAPIAGSAENEKQLKQRPLQLTLSVTKDNVEIWSPFDLIPAKKIALTPEGEPDLIAIHQTLLEAKVKFPTETKIVFAPHNGIKYNTLIALMDDVRKIEATDPPLFHKNATTGVDEAISDLFPEIVFGNLLGEP